MSKLTYEERLRKLNLPTLTYRRFRGDMIEGPPRGGLVLCAMCKNHLLAMCYVTFLFTLLCEIQIGCYAEVQPVRCAM